MQGMKRADREGKLNGDGIKAALETLREWTPGLGRPPATVRTSIWMMSPTLKRSRAVVRRVHVNAARGRGRAWQAGHGDGFSRLAMQFNGHSRLHTVSAGVVRWLILILMLHSKLI